MVNTSEVNKSNYSKVNKFRLAKSETRFHDTESVKNNETSFDNFH